ncbi:MAG: hypothetical protein ACOVSW_13170 [Candidatus Kapaibacteriota bacterium]|jgi:hypothetical protein
MIEQSRNLWPTIEQTITRTPLSILREQATYLGQQTHNIILGDVKSQQVSGTYTIAHYFYIVAPALGNYRYLLLHITHSAALLYPSQIYFDALKNKNLANSIIDNPQPITDTNFVYNSLMTNINLVVPVQVKDEIEFTEELQKIFSHENSLNIIRSLMVQSQEV